MPMHLAMSGPDFIVDIDGVRAPGEPDNEAAAHAGRPWLALHWRCCHAYSRIYRNAAGTRYEGRCPRCLKLVSVPIGSGGTSARFFEAD
jgi:hypothetical protein